MAWFTSPSGVTCVAAYDAVGAASLADSYANEANPGTYTAAPGVAPTWAYGTGWTFNGTTQYLTTGVAPTETWSMIARFSGGTGTTQRRVAGVSEGGALFALGADDGFNSHEYYNAGFRGVAGRLASGVMAFAGKAAYKDGVSDGTISAGTKTWTIGVFIGAQNNGGVPAARWNGSIQALAIYSGALSASDVATITAAMNALPVSAAKGLPVIAHHHRQIFGG